MSRRIQHLIIGLGLCFALTSVSPAGVVISELMYHPVSGTDFEFVELYNTGPGSVDLLGYALVDGVDYRFTNSWVLAEGSYAVIARDAAAFEVLYPGVTNRAPGMYREKLRNEGEFVSLYDGQSNLVFSVTYDNQAPWPEIAAGRGASLVIRDPLGSAAVTNWAASLEFHGSPGRAGAYAGRQIVINEVLTHSDPPFEDAIELYNPGTQEVAVGGWFLSDQDAVRTKYRIPDGVSVPAGGFTVIYEQAFNDPAHGTNVPFALSSALGDQVYLTAGDSAGELVTTEDFVTFGAAANGVSFGRYPDGDGPMFALLAPSFGEDSPIDLAQFRMGEGLPNAAPRVGPLVVNEIMYRPVETAGVDRAEDEYIELLNIQGAPLSLFDPNHRTNTWTLADAVTYAFPTGIVLEVGELILVVGDDPEAFRTRNGLDPSLRIFGPWTGKLDNAADRVRLSRPDNPDLGFVPRILVDEVDYRDTLPWPTGADGLGVSLEKNDPALPGWEPGNWHESPLGGTPGGVNSTFIPAGRIIISELIAHNETLRADEDGDYEDVIELYNRSTDLIDLEGWYLTDLRTDLRRWTFPAVSMNPGERLLLFASGKDRSTPHLHTNFRLDNDGEYLGLIRENGVTIEFELNGYPAVDPDVSLGLVETNVAAGLQYFRASSLGQPNTSAFFNTLVSAPTIFHQSPPSNGVVAVRMVVPAGATVYYTLDGSVPTESSLRYDDVFQAPVPVTVRARAFQVGALESVIASQTFLSAFVGINELMARNASTIGDILDFTDFDDWIELYHAGGSDLPIGGYYLSDDSDNRFLYRIPDGTVIPAGGFLLLWADGFNDQGIALHTNFKLSSEGEELSLYDPYGGLLDRLSFGPQVVDVSIGRKPDGAAQLVFFGEPTPQASNGTEGLFQNTLQHEMPETDRAPGFYGTQLLVGFTSAPGTEIRYTTNGDLPLRSSALYGTPLELVATTTLRARVFGTGKIPSPVWTGSYLIGQPDRGLPVVALTADQAYLFGDEKGIYENRIKGREIPMHMEWWEGVGEPRALSFDAGMRMFGFTFYPQRPFSIALRNRYGKDALAYPFFDDRRIPFFDRFIFRSSGDDWPNAFYKDALTHELVDPFMENGTQAYQPVVSYLNGEPYGLLNLREKLDEHWIRDNYGYDLDEIDYWEYEFDLGMEIVSAGDDASYVQLINFLRFRDLTDPGEYAWLQAHVNMDDFMNWVVLESYVGNSGWYHNRKWWKPRTPTGKWRWMIFDLDRGYETADIDVFKDIANRFRFWEFRRLMTNMDFRNRFIQRASAQLSNVYGTQNVHATLDRVIDRLTPGMPNHMARWEPEGAKGMPGWLAFNEGMYDLATNRHVIVRDQIRARLGLGEDCDVTIDASGSGGGRIMANYIELDPARGPQILFRDVPVSLRAIPEIGSALAGWSIQDGAGVPLEAIGDVVTLTPTNNLTIRPVFESTGERLIPSVMTNHFTLTAAGSPWLARGDWLIPSNITCTIEAGVEIRMPDLASIFVEGELLVNGTEAAPVVIRSNGADNARRPIHLDPEVQDPAEVSARWGTLFFRHASHTGRLNHLHVFDASESQDAVNGKGAISSIHSRLELNHVVVEQVHFPVFVQYGSFQMRNSRIRTDVTSDLVNVKHAEFALIENCDLQGNDAVDTDAIDYDNMDGGIIRSNQIYRFRGPNSDGIDIGEGAQNIEIVGNHIFDIRDKGVSIGQGSTVFAAYNLIQDCGQGFGIKDAGSSAEIDHHTFYRNGVDVAVFEKNYAAGGGHAIVRNSIFAQSITNAVSQDAASSLQVTYSLSDVKGLPVGEGVLQMDPLFAQPGETNFTLMAGSPAINRGDPGAPLDVDGTRTDLGAFAANLSTGYVVISEIHYQPTLGLSNEYEYVELHNPGAADLDLSGYHFAAGITFTFPTNTVLSSGGYLLVCGEAAQYAGNGYPVFTWSSGSLANEGEMLRLVDAASNVVDHVRYDNQLPWPLAAAGAGPSLNLIHPMLDNALPTSWVSGDQAGRTPGEGFSDYFPDKVYLGAEGSSMQLSSVGLPGLTYIIEFATDLEVQDWMPIGRLSVDANGNLAAPLPEAGASPQGYYRLRALYR